MFDKQKARFIWMMLKSKSMSTNDKMVESIDHLLLVKKTK